MKVTSTESVLLHFKWLYEFQFSNSSLEGLLEAVRKKNTKMPKVFWEQCSPIGTWGGGVIIPWPYENILVSTDGLILPTKLP